MNNTLEKLKRQHSQFHDRDGNPLTPQAAAKFLTSDPRGSTRTISRASQVELLQRIKKNLGELEKFAERLPRGGMRQRSLIKYIAELRVEVKNREQFIR